MKGYFKATGLVFVLLFLVTFGIKNHQLVKLYYYLGLQSRDFPLYILAYGCTIIGIFIGMLIGITNRFHQHKKIKALEKENSSLKAKAEKEITIEEKPGNQIAVEKFTEKKFFDEKTPVEKSAEEEISDEKTRKEKRAEEKISDEETAEEKAEAEKAEETQIIT